MSPVEDGVRHVGRLGPGGPGVRDHRLEHLGGHDDGLGVLARDLDGTLLDQRHLLQRQLHAEVAPGHHDGVECQDDGLEILDGFRLLELGDDGNVDAHLVHHLVHEVDVRRRPHERQGDEVRPQAEGEPEVGDVLLAQRGDRDVHARQGHALVVGDGTALGHDALDVVTVDVFDGQSDVAVVDEEAVSRAGVVRQPLVGGRDAILGALHLGDGDDDTVALLPLVPALEEAAESDLGALQVREDTDGPAGLVGGLADPSVVGLVVGVLSVAEVEAGDIHARVDQLSDSFLRRDGGTQGADDLGTTIHSYQSSPLDRPPG